MMKKIFKVVAVFVAVVCVLSGTAFSTNAETFKEYKGSKTAAVLSDTIRLFSSPDENSKAIKKLSFGSKLKIVAVSKDFLKVKSGKSFGYVKRKNVVTYYKSKKHIALTFDDGPNSYTTPTVLKALKNNKCKATFFVVGQNIGDNTGKLIKEAYSIGCDIGNHSYSHPNLANLSVAEIKSQIKNTDSKIKKYIGKKAGLVRTPYGSSNTTVKSAIGKPNIYWSVDTEDWRYRDTSRLITYVNNNAYDGAVVLMHDIHSSTVNGVDTICKNLKKANYEMLTVRELAAVKGQKLEKGNTYYSFK